MSRPRRATSPPRRREQAAATRRAILDAAQRAVRARRLRRDDDRRVAGEAGVATKTVYIAFETKSGLLRALWHLLLRGDEDDVPIGERAWYREVLDEPDPARRLRLGRAQLARRSRSGRAACCASSARAALVDADRPRSGRGSSPTSTPTRARSSRRPSTERRAAAPGLGVARATDILWTLNHPDVWHLLVEERGWTPAAWERWFLAAVREQLLED